MINYRLEQLNDPWRNPDEIQYIPVGSAYPFIRNVFEDVVVPTEDASVAADVLITSDLRGIESHGIGRLKYYNDQIKSGQHKVVTHLKVVRESPTIADIDGNHGMGMVIGKRAMHLAIDKASQFGMGSVAVRNSIHFGIDGY
jgi:LDH2 family malate/lactate/ureidoglycolate dehydrogenase